ncbi:RmlC-like cupins superfamily protein [Prunus dulcis]|uniref:Germin-like protein n=2 Tax=Prunus dulcis TaxID=3755 RepID=A0A4Y1RWU0_PRUDU|nr:RmlC-like cupins superfamily protein [Prunus dulcis]
MKDFHPTLRLSRQPCFKSTAMKGVHFLISTLAILAFATFLASASDPSPLQDFCVALKDIKDGVFVNGKFCKDPKLANANDFFFSGLQNPRNTQNPVGSNVTAVNVDNLAGLNTLGISLARLDFAPNGLNPPHTHPRASEILAVLEGTLYVGFVTSNGDGNRLFTKVLNKGDVFVFPIGLIHFQLNVGHVDAVAFAGLSSQNPGVITIANAVFGSKPPINPDVLTKAFQVDNKVVDYLQKQFWYDNN